MSGGIGCGGGGGGGARTCPGVRCASRSSATASPAGSSTRRWSRPRPGRRGRGRRDRRPGPGGRRPAPSTPGRGFGAGSADDLWAAPGGDRPRRGRGAEPSPRPPSPAPRWRPGCRSWWTSRSRPDAGDGARAGGGGPARPASCSPCSRTAAGMRTSSRPGGCSRRGRGRAGALRVPLRPLAAPGVNPDAWRERPDPADAGGLLADLGSHLIDQAIVLFGPPVAVRAELDRRRAGRARQRRRLRGAARAPGGRPEPPRRDDAGPAPGPRMRLTGLAGAWEVHGLDPQEAALRDGARPGGPRFRRRRRGRLGRPPRRHVAQAGAERGRRVRSVLPRGWPAPCARVPPRPWTPGTPCGWSRSSTPPAVTGPMGG